MNEENEFVLSGNDLTILLRKLLGHGGKVIAEVKIDSMNLNYFKIKIKKENE